VRVDLRVPPCRPVAEVVDFCLRAEDAGFSGVGLLDSQHYFRDTFVVMAQVLGATDSLRVHPAVTCPGPRDISVIASAAKTVQELGEERFELWLGRGGTSTRSAGLPRLTIGQMRQALAEIRWLLNGEPSSARGPTTRLAFGEGRPVPIFMAVAGPLSTRLAAEMCDGVAFRSAPNRSAIEEARGWIAEGADRAHRDPRGIEQWFQMFCVVRNTREDAVRTWSPNLVPLLAKPDAPGWLSSRLPDIRLSKPVTRAIQRAEMTMASLYPDARHAVAWDAAVDIAQAIPFELQEALGDQMAVLGGPALVLSRIQELERMGIQNVFLYPAWTFQLPEPELQGFRDVIGPGLRSSAAGGSP
jgi:5,10-methylenetetrahydromethanopterin reductase